MLITIKERNYVFVYDFKTIIETGADIVPVSYEYHINPAKASSFRFHNNYDSSFALVERATENCRQLIVLNYGGSYEVIAFEESAGGEFQRVKRELLEYFSSAEESVVDKSAA